MKPKQLTLAEARALARHAAMAAEAERAAIIHEEDVQTRRVAHQEMLSARPDCCQDYCPACGCCACCGYEFDCVDCHCQS